MKPTIVVPPHLVVHKARRELHVESHVSLGWAAHTVVSHAEVRAAVLLLYLEVRK